MRPDLPLPSGGLAVVGACQLISGSPVPALRRSPTVQTLAYTSRTSTVSGVTPGSGGSG